MKNLAGWLCLLTGIIHSNNDAEIQSGMYLIAGILCFMWSDLTEKDDE